MNLFRSPAYWAGATLVLMTIFTSNALAQQEFCPDPPPDFPGIPFEWGGCYETFIDIGGGPCWVEICYCSRAVANGWFDFYITSVSELESGCLAGTNPAQILREAALQFTFNPPQEVLDAWPCPTCPTSAPNWRAVNALCVTFGAAGNTTVIPCGGNAGFCWEIFQICCVDGVRHVISAETRTAGSCPNPPPTGGTCFEICN